MRKLTDFQKKYLETLRIEELKQLEKYANEIIAFKDFLRPAGVYLDDSNFKYYQTSGIIATYPDLINYLHPCLNRDKEGLFDFNVLTQHFERRMFTNGYLIGKNFMLMAHPYFRRAYQQVNNFAPSFIDLYWSLNNSKIEKYIALDPDSVKINIDGYGYMERDTWFGAEFKQEINCIPDGIVKLRPPLDIDDSDISFFFASVYSLDIKWASKGKIKTFQAEEFKTESITITKGSSEYYPVRYVHAEFDTELGCFRHFDGAIHFYTAVEYFKRRDSDFNYNNKNLHQIKTLSEKLFKLNGVVTVEAWIELTSHFFAGNSLVFEYFEGKYPQHLVEILAKIRASDN